MKVRIILFMAVLALSAALRGEAAAQASSAPFAYPSVPDSITEIQDRYDYFVSHFWDRVDLKKAFSSKGKVAEAFIDYVTPMRFATADTVYASVDRFVSRLSKQPRDLLYIADLAEASFYADTAAVPSDELYVAFLRSILACKKIDRNLAARHEMHLRQLEHSLTGHPLGSLRLTDREGRAVRFVPRKGQALVIYINDPECDDCRLARIRLAANVRLRELIESGIIAVVAITPDEPSEQWRKAVADYPEEWLIGADPDLDTYLDLRAGFPSFYLVDEEGNIAAKHLTIDTLLNIISRI